MLTTPVAAGRLVRFEYEKPGQSYTHRSGTVEKLDNERGLLKVRVATEPKVQFKDFKVEQIHNFQIVG